MYCTFKYTKCVFNSRHLGHISTPITITMKIFPVVLEFFHTSTLLLVCIMSDLRSSTTQAYLVVVYSFPKHEWQMHFKKKLIKQKWNKFHTTVTNSSFIVSIPWIQFGFSEVRAYLIYFNVLSVTSYTIFRM